MLVKGSEVLNKMLYADMSLNLPGNSFVDLSSYLDTSGNALWDSLNPNGMSSWNCSEMILRYKGGLSQSQVDISNWSYNINNLGNFGKSLTNQGNCDFVLGSGNTPETYEDYKIESEVLLNLAGKSWFLNSDGKLALSKTYQNTFEDNITISEVGFIFIVAIGSSSSSNAQKAVLCSREVLSEPITLTFGETITVSLMNDKIGLTK